MTKFLLLCLLLCAGPIQARGNDGLHLLVFGDSLSAAYGMDEEMGWARLLEQQWQEQGKTHRITNASISGETTDGGLARLPLTLNEVQPDVVLIELGANDGLRGHPLTRIEHNLTRMVETVQTAGAIPILVGISLPPSLGPRYVDGFRRLFPTVAKTKNVAFVDFYRADFFTTPGYIQTDGLHPTETPQSIIRDMLLSFFKTHEMFQ